MNGIINCQHTQLNTKRHKIKTNLKVPTQHKSLLEFKQFKPIKKPTSGINNLTNVRDFLIVNRMGEQAPNSCNDKRKKRLVYELSGNNKDNGYIFSVLKN